MMPSPRLSHPPALAALAAQPEEIIHGTVEHIVFRRADNHFTVLRLQRDAPAQSITAIGELLQVMPGERLQLRGRWTEHPTYGRRFRIVSSQAVLPTTTEGLVRYLGSGWIPGVGPALAGRLVERFGERTLEIIAMQSARLREVEGIGPARIEALSESVRTRRAEGETMAFLQGLGVGPVMAKKIFQRYGQAAAEVVRHDPYGLAIEIGGIGFRTADQIGRRCDIGVDDPRRAAGAALHLLDRAAEDGHVFLPREVLQESAVALEVPEAPLAEALATLTRQGQLVVEGEALYTPRLHAAEVSVAKHIAELATRLPKLHAPPLSDEAQATGQPGGLQLHPAQAQAIDRSLRCGLLVLTGGPGTGKTTTMRALVRAHEAAGRKLLLCAPTGRAAKRLSEVTERPACTIHRALEWNPANGGFARDARQPLEVDLVLVDEASMLDIELTRHLLAALPAQATLVLVGDVDQLPPVGPGQVLREIIDSQAASVVRLHEVFRQAQRSAIVRGAHEVLAGQAPTPTADREQGEGDLFFVAAPQPEILQRRLLETLERIGKVYGLHPQHDVQVVAPMRRGPYGTEQLNELLQRELNAAHRPAALSTGELPRLWVGDKVMQLKNDYEREVFNGDLGEVRRIEGAVTYVDIDGRQVAYSEQASDALSLAYACTVHKVQGSEFPATVLIMHRSHHLLLSRALLYTAITRARRLVVLMGDASAIARAAAHAPDMHVYTRLKQRIQSHVCVADDAIAKAAPPPAPLAATKR